MKKRIGNVYWSNSQFIDANDIKKRRQYVVVRDDGKFVKVSKIRGYNENIQNNDRLFKLNLSKYPKLKKQCGVDNYVYSYRNRPKQKLSLEDKSIFDNEPEFNLTSHDTHRVLIHTKDKRHKKRK